MSLASCLYEGAVVHSRTSPVTRRFSYRLYFVYLDLDELPGLFAKRWLWSVRGPNLAWFRRADHLGPESQPLAESVRDLVKEQLGWRPAGPIRLLTQLRQFGFQMNPVSFFYCFDSSGQALQAVVAEVHNTPWNERHCYVLEMRGTENESRHNYRALKEFHVSPFLPMQLRYDFRLSRPGPRLMVRIQASQRQDIANAGQPAAALGMANAPVAALFRASLALRRVPFDRSNCRRVLLRYPLMTVRIFIGIYAQALRLWWLGVPVVPHPRTVSPQPRPTEAASTRAQPFPIDSDLQDASP